MYIHYQLCTNSLYTQSSPSNVHSSKNRINLKQAKRERGTLSRQGVEIQQTFCDLNLFHLYMTNCLNDTGTNFFCNLVYFRCASHIPLYVDVIITLQSISLQMAGIPRVSQRHKVSRIWETHLLFILQSSNGTDNTYIGHIREMS